MCGRDQDRPISVLHVLGMIGPRRGGSAAATLGAAVATRATGDHATILTTLGDDEERRVAPPGVEIVACRRLPPRHVSFSGALVVWLWRNVRRFDVVEVHEVFAFPTLAVWALARWRRVPYVVRPHGSLEPHDRLKHARVKALLRPWLRSLLRSAAAVWLATDREEAGLADLGDGFRTVVSPVAVPPSDRVGDGPAFRNRHDLADADRVVLFVGRLDPTKGLDRLVTAFETVADTCVRARLVVAGSGDGAFAAAIHDRAAASRHAPSIRMVGFVSGQWKADAFAAADLFVLHSDKESFGIAPVEALQAGTPVLLSREVYVADALAPAGAAEVVDVDDVDGLAGRMTALLGDPARLRRMAAGAELATGPYRPERVAERDACLRRELLARGAARRVTG